MELFILDAIKNVGFPIFVAIYLLFKIGKKMDRLSNRIDKLLDNMENKDKEDK